MPDGDGTVRGLANDVNGFVVFYNMVCGTRGFTMPPHMVPFARALLDTRIEKLLITVGPGSGKALHPDTPVLFGDGWRPISSARVGDVIRCPDGVLTARVKRVVPQPASRLLRVRFSDGREVLANKEHQWLAHHKKLKGDDRLPDGLRWQLCTTQEIADRMQSYEALRWYVPLTEPVELPEQKLPVSPYALGVVLGDGNAPENGGVRVCNPDIEIMDRVRKEIGDEFPVRQVVGNSSGCPNWSIRGLGAVMRLLDLNGKRSWEKWVPPIYKTGSVAQRLALLQGLMDTDGTVSDGGGANFSSTSWRLAADVQELVWSLGGIAKLVERQTHFTAHGVRKLGRKSYRVHIRMRDPGTLFHLSRKRDRRGVGQYSETLKLRIESITVEPEQSDSICISLDSADGLFLVDNYVVTHNSTTLSEVFPAFVLGHDPTLSVLGISAGEALMQGFLRSVMETIEWSPMYRHLFPKVRPDKAAGWSSERGMFVTGREIGNPDASFAAAGVDSKSLTGKHGRIILCDDLHDKENSGTIEQCNKVWDTWFNTILGRADPRGARYIVAGRRWNQHDVYKMLADTQEFVVMSLPAERENTNKLWIDVQVPDGLVCCFTEEQERPEPGVNIVKRRRIRLED